MIYVLKPCDSMAISNEMYIGQRLFPKINRFSPGVIADLLVLL